MRVPGCCLCEYERRTALYYEDWRLRIFDCETCGPGHPVMAAREHDGEDALSYGKKIAPLVFPLRVEGFRDERRSSDPLIREHPHCHILLRKETSGG